MAEFPTEPSVEIARRLEIRGADSSSWIAILTPLVEAEDDLESLQADLSSLVQRRTRVLDLGNGTFKELREQVNQPPDDIVILTARRSLAPERWSFVDLARSALERKGPVVLWLSAGEFSALSEHAPNIRSFIGASIFVSGPDGGLMTESERLSRLKELSDYYQLSDEEIIRRAEAGRLAPEPQLVEWLVLLGRGDLV